MVLFLNKISLQDQEKYFYNDQQYESSEFNEQENNEQESSFITPTAETIRQAEISNEEISNLILTLNAQQRKILNEVEDWTIKNQSHEL